MADSLVVVSLEFKRLQTYLFAVPRLRAMVGANAILGETIRGYYRVKADGVCFQSHEKSLPALAASCGAQAPKEIVAGWQAGKRPEEYFMIDGVWQDDPVRVAQHTGILSRDGGHFEAVFPDEEKARRFVEQAQQLIADRLAGIMSSAILRVLGEDFVPRGEGELIEQPSSGCVLDLPQAEVCQWSGNEPASVDYRVSAEERPLVSQSLKERLERCRAFDQGETHDVLGILRRELLARIGAQERDELPAEFAQLAVEGYMAVIHLDGNGIGKRSKAVAGEGDFFAQWRRRESFFHAMRVGVREAFLNAVGKVFNGLRTGAGKVPCRPLMLGGDDLVMVCGAPYALPFVAELAEQLKQTTKELPMEANGQKGPLTIGAGVAIVPSSFPFYRAYELAEQLAESAKRLGAESSGEDGNVVDWLCITESWHGDLHATRYDQAVRGKLLLTGKPYRVLGTSGRTLQTMLDHARQIGAAIGESRLARSQLYGLVRALPEGRHAARFAAEVLPGPLRQTLRELGYLGAEGPWQPIGGASETAMFVTRVADLLELCELRLLEPTRTETPKGQVAPSMETSDV